MAMASSKTLNRLGLPFGARITSLTLEWSGDRGDKADSRV
jgi:hypothetical protein